MKPHPFAMLGGGALSVVTPPPFGSPATSRRREVHGLCAPASRRVCLCRGAGAPERT
jgi:hypothetical protein